MALRGHATLPIPETPALDCPSDLFSNLTCQRVAIRPLMCQEKKDEKKDDKDKKEKPVQLKVTTLVGKVMRLALVSGTFATLASQSPL
jgi:hypothetical protein